MFRALVRCRMRAGAHASDAYLVSLQVGDRCAVLIGLTRTGDFVWVHIVGAPSLQFMQGCRVFPNRSALHLANTGWIEIPEFRSGVGENRISKPPAIQT
jgi:hypothetical protein